MIGIFINLWNRLIGAGGAAISYVLDEYSGAAAAYSLRKLSSTYGGSAVRVRRASDNTEQDIGFVGQDLDETALMNFVGYQNLLQRSEEFNDVYWTKTNLITSANTTTSPNGTLTADTITETVVSGRHQVLNNITTISGQTYTFSIYAKQAVGTRLFGIEPVGSGGAGNNQVAVFDLVNGISLGSPAGAYVGAPFDSSNTSIQSVGNGWYRISTTTTVTGTTYAVATGLLNAFSAAGMSYLGDGTSGVYIWGAQLNVGTTAQPYQVTTSAARSGDGFVTKWYTQDGNGENLFQQSQTFESAYWNKTATGTAVSSNSILAPDGTLTADSMSEIAVTGDHYIGLVSGLTLTNATYNFSCYYKANQRTWAAMSMFNGTNTLFAYFDLQNGVLGNVDAGATASIQSVGNGWYRCSMTRTMSTASLNNYVGIGIAPSNGVNSYLGVVGSGVYIWGAQISQSSWLQGYQATTTAQVFRRDASQSTAANQPRIVGGGVIERENGKASIRFDGTDDFLSLASDITYTTTGNQYVAAVFTPAVAITTSSSQTLLGTIGTVSGRMIYFLGALDGTLANERVSYATLVGGPVIGYGQTITDLSPTPKLHSISFDPPSLFNIFQNSIQQQFTNYSGGAFSSSQYPSIFSRIGAYSGAGGSNFLGDMQEIILYGTSRSANRGDIDRNLGAYYQTQWTGASSGLLDQFGGAAAAYSLRNLSSSYRGPLIRVRRSSDNAETDIGGTYNGDLDVASLLSFTGGQNLQLQSETFTTPWVTLRGSVTANTTIAPDGALTADSAICNIASVSGLALFGGQMANTTTQTTFTGSCYIKAGNRGFANIFLFDRVNSSARQYFNLTTGELASYGFNGTGVNRVGASIQNVGNGWYRCSLTATFEASRQVELIVFPAAPADNNVTCVVGDFGYVWGAQLNTGILQPYIPTTTTAVNGVNAFVTKWYTQDNNYQNLVLQSENFQTSPWGTFNSSVIANTTTAPDGTLTADTLIENTALGSHQIFQIVTTTANQTYTYSVYAKLASGSRYLGILPVNSGANGNNGAAVFDLVNGAFLGTATPTTGLTGNPFTASDVSIQSVGNGWWRCSVRVSVSGTSYGCTLRLYNAFSNGTSTGFEYTGDGTNGLYIWGAQLNEGPVAQPYTATTTTVSQRRDAVQATAANQPRIVNAGGVESEGNKPALFFDGVDDTINFDTVAPLFAGEDIPLSAFSTVRSSQTGWFFAIANSAASQPIHGFSLVAGSGIDNFRRSSTQIIVANTDPSTIYKLNSHMFAGTTLSVSNNAVDNIVDAPMDVAGLTGLNMATIGALRYQPFPNGTTFFTGDVGEFVLYRANQFSLRQSIHSNINSYYQIYWQGNGTALLDNYSGASAAYSLRNLSSAYTGPLIRVRRSNDNVERDIYGTFGGDLDIASLVAFVGANSGFVTTWYDQSGSARHASIGTATNQPRIVNAGVVDTQNGKPAVWFDGVDDTLFSNVSLLTTNNKIIFSLFMLRSQSPTFSVIIQAFKDTYGPVYTLGLGVNIIEVNALQSGASVVTNVPLLATVNYYAGVQSSALRKNGVNAGTSMRTNGYDNPTNQIWIGSGQGGSPAAMTASEFIIYTTNQTASIPTIESNINNYYKIY